MDSSNCPEGVGDFPLANSVAIRVHISDRAPLDPRAHPLPPSASRPQSRKNAREMDVSAHPSRCAQTEISPPPSS